MMHSIRSIQLYIYSLYIYSLYIYSFAFIHSMFTLYLFIRVYLFQFFFPNSLYLKELDGSTFKGEKISLFEEGAERRPRSRSPSPRKRSRSRSRSRSASPKRNRSASPPRN